MLRQLSIRNFAVVESLDAEFGEGFTVLTGETGAGKSILLDAISLILGDRFETGQIRAGSDRAEIAAEFALEDSPAARAILIGHDFSESETLLIRRVLDAQGRSRAYVNGSPATLAQLKDIGEALVNLHGQHAHQSLGKREIQRALLDGYGGFTSLAHEVASAWRTWRDAAAVRDRARRLAEASDAERDILTAKESELSRLELGDMEWTALAQAQSRLAHAASLIEIATAGEDELAEGDAAILARLSGLLNRLRQGATHDTDLADAIGLVESASIAIDEAARSLRGYRQHLDLDPAELARVEARLAAIHEVARRYRVQPEALPLLLDQTRVQLAALAAASDVVALERGAGQAEASYRALAEQLSAKRALAASELSHRASAMLAKLAMRGARLEIGIEPLAEPASYGLEEVDFRIATHPKQAPGPIARIASGGELSRIGLAIEVVLSDVAAVPTLIFDEVDAGIGGAVAATVGGLLQALGRHRQVLCVTHLPQVAARGDHHYRVRKEGDAESVRSELGALSGNARVDELARMLGGLEITAKTRAHARELLEAKPAPDTPSSGSPAE